MGLASLLTDSSLSALCCHFMMRLTSPFGPLSPVCLGAAWSRLGLPRIGFLVYRLIMPKQGLASSANNRDLLV